VVHGAEMQDVVADGVVEYGRVKSNRFVSGLLSLEGRQCKENWFNGIDS
jgi:hypothetical protein